MGVLNGAERFDHGRGYQFSTYVQYWIRKSVFALVAKHARGIRIPVWGFFLKSYYREQNKVLKS